MLLRVGTGPHITTPATGKGTCHIRVGHTGCNGACRFKHGEKVNRCAPPTIDAFDKAVRQEGRDGDAVSLERQSKSA